MDRATDNKLSLTELAEIEELAHRSQTCDARVVLRLAVALREALQEKENACALALVYRNKAEGCVTKESESVSADLTQH